jgi:hypothetical protein
MQLNIGGPANLFDTLTFNPHGSVLDVGPFAHVEQPSCFHDH